MSKKELERQRIYKSCTCTKSAKNLWENPYEIDIYSNLVAFAVAVG